MLAMMNIGHGAMTKWGLQHRDIPADIDILDIGSGGGANIRRKA
ncbi:MAG: hypothetical protein ACOX62_11965 [Christensenellales bacterium]|jgi:hypothetical protein